MSRSPLGSGATQQAAEICHAKRRELWEGRKRSLIAIIKAEEFQAPRARIGNIQHRVDRQLVLHAKVPLLVIGGPQIGRDGIKLRSVGVRKRGRRKSVGQGVRPIHVEGCNRAIERISGREGRIGGQVPAGRRKGLGGEERRIEPRAGIGVRPILLPAVENAVTAADHEFVRGAEREADTRRKIV